MKKYFSVSAAPASCLQSVLAFLMMALCTLAHAAAFVHSPSPVVSQQKKEILFIENNLPDYAQLKQGAPAGMDVVMLDASDDGLRQIAQALQDKRDVQALHLISHGSSGQMALGTSLLNSNALTTRQAELAAIRKALAANADILLYGCQVAEGESGRRFISELAEVTGAHVAASENLVGSERRGGSWALASRTASISSSSLKYPQYQYVFPSVAGVFTSNVSTPQPSPSTSAQVYYDGLFGTFNIPNIQYDLYYANSGTPALPSGYVAPYVFTSPPGAIFTHTDDSSVSFDSGVYQLIIKSHDGTAFKLSQFDWQDVGCKSTYTATAYLNGISQGTYLWTINQFGTYSGTFSPGSYFNNINEVRITATAGATGVCGNILIGEGIANIVFADPELPVPTVTAVSPIFGSTAGGTVVTITGANLSAATSVSFGTSSATPTINSNTSITATAPAHAAGQVDVTVTTTSGTSAINSSDKFTYVAPVVAGAASATVAHGSSNNPITLNLSGGAATSVAVSTAASHGTATASGTSISYTPTASYSGTDTFAYTATNSAGTSAPATVTITISPATIAYAPSSPASGTVGVVYSQTLASASGGTATYTYTIASGSLPSGITLASNGTLSGTPTAGGTFNFTVTVTDSSTGTGPFSATSATLSLVIGAPSISVSPPTLSAATVGTAYNATISSSGGTSSYSYAVTAGALPAGLSLNGGTGVLSGTPTAGGTYNFTVTATDSSTGTGPYLGSRAYTLLVNPASVVLSPSSGSSLTGTAGVAYTQSFSASSGTAPYSYALTVNSGTMPTGLSFNTSSGVLSGTPTALGTVHFTVTATDSSTGSGPYSVGNTYTLMVSSPVISISPTTLPNPTTGSAYSQAVSASGGAAAYTYTITSGSLPVGLSLNTSTGGLSGNPTAAGTFNFTISATDANSFTGSRAYTMAVAAPTISVSPVSLSAASAAAAYSTTLSASGGTSNYSFAVTAGALPSGLSLNASTGVLSGTPTVVGSFNFNVTATDSSGGTGGPFVGSRAYTLTVAAPAMSLSPAPGALSATVFTSYSQAFVASNGTAPYTYMLSINSGNLPVGLTFSTSTGVLSGAPTSVGTVNFTVTGQDSTGGVGSPFLVAGTYTLTTGSPAITLAPATLTTPVIATAYSQTVTGGGTAPYTYSITSGALPAGLSLNPSTGVISGTPTATGAYNFTVTATDANSLNGSRSYSGSIIAPVVSVSPGSLPGGQVELAYSQTFSASGGTAPYTFSISSGSLPMGLSLNVNTGVISGTPTSANTYNFTVKATDSTTGTGSPFFGTQAYSVVMNALPVGTLTFATPAVASVQMGNSLTNAAISTLSGGSYGAISYSSSNTAVATVNGSGVITPVSVGTTTITATQAAVTGVNVQATQTYVLTVTASSIATLNTLSLSDGTFSPAFAAATTSYMVSVSSPITTIRVTPTVTDSHATVKVNGTTVASGSASSNINLNVGNNTISVVVTAQDGTTNTTYTITVNRAAPVIGSIAGSVYADVNGNGVFDGADVRLAGVVLNLSGTETSGDSVNRSVTTDANGNFIFMNLHVGTYNVTEVQPAGYADFSGSSGTSAGSAGGTVALNSVSGIVIPATGGNFTGYSFREMTSSIAGYIYQDDNDNAQKDGGDSGIAGVQITLNGSDAAGNAVSLNAQSGSDGSFSFNGLRGGTYTLTETRPLNYAAGKASAGDAGGSVDNSGHGTAPATRQIANLSLAAGQSAQNYLFGELQTTALLGYVYVDSNNNGIKDAGEAGLAGVHVTLSGKTTDGSDICSLRTSCVTTTGADGRYSFTNLVPGTYNLLKTSADIDGSKYADGIETAGLAGGTVNNQSFGSLPYQNSITSIAVSSAAITANGGKLDGYLFGVTPRTVTGLKLPIVSGSVMLNSAAKVNITGTAVSGWSVTLSQNGKAICKVTTNAQGFYQFDNLACTGYQQSGLPTGSGFSISFSRAGSGNLALMPVSGGNAGTPTLGAITGLNLGSQDEITRQDLPLDPSGVIYDSTTRQPVAGATISISGPAGFNPAQHLVGGSAVQVQTTGADGMYQYLLTNGYPSGVYTLKLTQAPSGYMQTSSTILPPCMVSSLNVGPVPNPALVQASDIAPPLSTTRHDPKACTGLIAGGATTTQYYLSFTITNGVSAPILNNHIPLDRIVAATASLQKSGDKTTAEIGDSVRYTVIFTQQAGTPAGQVSVRDMLPPGFKYIPGSATVNGTAIADPAGGVGPVLGFNLGAATIGQQLSLSYRVRIGVGSMQGDGTNRAVAYTCFQPSCLDSRTLSPVAGATASNQSSFKVIVGAGVFTTDACVAGKVFVDLNRNGMQEKDEPGIAGVRLYLENGVNITTDTDGKYSYCGLTPQTHVIKVDSVTLPEGSVMGITSNRNLGDSHSLLLDVKNGELIRADFAEVSGSEQVLEQVRQRSRAGRERPQEKRGSPGIHFSSQQKDMSPTPMPANVPVQGEQHAQ